MSKWRVAILGAILIALAVVLWIDRRDPVGHRESRLPSGDEQIGGSFEGTQKRGMSATADHTERDGLSSEPLSRLTGKVVDAGSGPLAGATIASAGPWSATTNDEGTFVLELPRGLHTLRFSAHGYAPAFEHALAPGEIEISLYPEAVIEGRIVQGASAKGVANAFLLLNGNELREGMSDGAGAFRFDMLRPGQYTITARAAGWVAPAETEIELDAGETKQILIRATPALSVSANIIVEETNEPCRNSYVVFRNAVALAEERGDSKGRVTIDGLFPGRYSVRVDCATWGTATPPPLVVDHSLGGLRWIIPAGPRIRGTVLHRDGTPGSAIMVFSRLLGTSESRVSTATHTDSRGRFELRGLRAGSHSVLARVDDVFTSSVVRVGHDDVDDIVLRPDSMDKEEATLEGSVVTIDDQPVPGMRLVLEPSRAANEFAPSKQVVTDEHGRFSSVLNAEWIDIRLLDLTEFSLVGRSKESRSVRLTPRSTTRMRLIVSRSDQSVRGRVVDASREPIVGAAVVAMPEEEDRDGEIFLGVSKGWMRPAAQALSGGTGEFELTDLMPGRYAIRAKVAGGGDAILRQVQAPGTIELVIAEPGSISGHATGIDPAPRIVVVASHSSNEFSRRGEFSSPTGAFSLGDLPPGHYRLTARGEGVGGTAEVDLQAGQHLRDVKIELQAANGVSGRVVSGREGRGIADCHLYLRGEPSPVFLNTDADGGFLIAEAGPGPRVLDVFCAGGSVDYCSDRIELNLPGDRRLNLAPIVLPPAPGADTDLGALGLELRGNQVVSVRAASAAFRAGLRPGDVVTTVGGFDVRGRPAVLRCFLSGRSGRIIEVSLTGGARRILTVP